MEPIWQHVCGGCVYLGSFRDPIFEKRSFDCYACVQTGRFKLVYDNSCVTKAKDLENERFIQFAFFNAKEMGLYKFHEIPWDYKEQEYPADYNCSCSHCMIPFEIINFTTI